jgi:integrase
VSAARQPAFHSASSARGTFRGGWGFGDLEMARTLGKLRQRGNGWQVEVWDSGTRHRIGRAPIGGHWTALRTRELAEMVLAAIRSEVAGGATVEQAVAPFLSRPTHATLVTTKAQAWIKRERERCRAGDISPTTLREYERYVAGAFAYWKGAHVFQVGYGALEDWSGELARGGLSAKTRSNVLGAFRVFLRWLEMRGDLKTVPRFPSIPRSEYAPTIITRETQDAILEAIPWETRGAFLAMAHTLRPGEARAVELRDYRDGDLFVRRAVKGRHSRSPVREAKERNVRVVGCDDRLVFWIAWRLAQLTPAEKLKGTGRLFVNPKGRDHLGRWSHDGLEYVWRKACRAVGVTVGLYEGTKHATSTDLLRRGEDLELVRKFLGHKDARSTERYAKLADRNVSDAMRRRT